MTPITFSPHEEEVLEFLKHIRKTTGIMPSAREIQNEFRFSSQTAARDVCARGNEKKSSNAFPGVTRGSRSTHSRRHVCPDPRRGSQAEIAGLTLPARGKNENPEHVVNPHLPNSHPAYFRGIRDDLSGAFSTMRSLLSAMSSIHAVKPAPAD